MVRGATPDVVLTGVELLARGLDDERPGSATSWSSTSAARPPTCTRVVELDPEDGALAPRGRRHHAGDPHRRGRPRHALVGGHHRRGGRRSTSPTPPRRRHDDPGFLPGDRRRARTPTRRSPRAAVGLALRRHAGRSQVVVSPEGRVVERTGKDLREVDLLVGSGGVLRNGRPGVADRVLAGSTGDVEGGWQLPRRPRVVVDHDYVLAAAGLLAEEHPEAAYRLVQRLAQD